MCRDDPLKTLVFRIEHSDRRFDFPCFLFSPAVGESVWSKGRTDGFPAGGVVMCRDDPLKTLVFRIEHPEADGIYLPVAIGMILQFHFQSGKFGKRRSVPQIEFRIVLFRGIPAQTGCGTSFGTVRRMAQSLIHFVAVVDICPGRGERIEFDGFRFSRQRRQQTEQKYRQKSFHKSAFPELRFIICSMCFIFLFS